MSVDNSLSDEVLDMLMDVSQRADPPPWTAIVEGRDQLGGDSFIMIGMPNALMTDMYVTRDRIPADPAELDVIALSRSYLPLLVHEVRRLRGLVDADGERA